MNQSSPHDCQFQAESLIAEVSQAFAGTKSPSGIEAVDGNRESAGDYWQARNFFDGRHWTEIDCSTLLRSYPSGVSSSVNFLGQAGFLHYLPLFMLCVLKDFGESGLLVDSLLNRLTLPVDSPGRIHFRDDFGLLSTQQCRTVAQFIEYLDRCQSDYFLPSEDSEQMTAPKAALCSLWSNYL